jgi:hypothetical protein
MRWRLMCLLVCGLLLGLAFGRGASASTFVELSLADLLEVSNAVVVGTATEQTSVWENADGARARRIVTYTRVRIDKVIDGAVPSPDVWVRTLGGQVGDIGQVVDGEAVLVPQQSGIMFLRARADGTHAVAAMGQGHFPVRVLRAGEPPRIAVRSALGRLVPAPEATRPARLELDQKTVDEAVQAIEAARRGRAR